MAQYTDDEGLEALLRPSSAEIIIGSKEAKRSTKTFIPEGPAAILLSMIENHAKAQIRTLQKLHYLETGVKLKPARVIDQYPGCRRWVTLHQQLLEHFASQGGFSIQAIVKMEQARSRMQQPQLESQPDD